jgi:hypothetical protein
MLSDAQEDGMKSRLVIALLTLSSLTAYAQSKNPVSDALRQILPGRQKNTVAAIEAMPADKFGYKPTADQMTFGHLVTHMIEANNFLCAGASGVAEPKAAELKDTDAKDKLLAGLKASFDYCSEGLAKMDDSKLGEMTKGFGDHQVTRAWAALVLSSSWADHYGMAAMYLRQNGLTPPSAASHK